ncbi:MAG: hypothetical protein ACYC0X_04760 [Pirellulaceae bacterium]
MSETKRQVVATLYIKAGTVDLDEDGILRLRLSPEPIAPSDFQHLIDPINKEIREGEFADAEGTFDFSGPMSDELLDRLEPIISTRTRGSVVMRHISSAFSRALNTIRAGAN